MTDLINSLTISAYDGILSLSIWGWQALILLSFVWLIKKICRPRIAALHYNLWLLGLLATAMLPLGVEVFSRYSSPRPLAAPLRYVVELPEAMTARPQPVPLSTQPVGDTPSAPAEVPSPAGSPDGPSRIWLFLFAAWVIGATIHLLRLCVSYRKLHDTRSRARPIAIAGLGCEDMDLPALKRVKIGLSPEVQAPLLTGILRPMILLPVDILSWTSVEERRSILQHELAHVERLDHFVNPFQALLGMIFFFHPMIRFASHQLSLERELACDERVLSLGVTPATYVESILKVVERSIAPDLAHQPASFASRKSLERRIAMILRPNRLPALTRHWPFLVLPAVLIAVMIWLVTGRHAAAGRWPAAAADNQWSSLPSDTPTLPQQAESVLDGVADITKKQAVADPVLRSGRTDKPLTGDKNSEQSGARSHQLAEVRNRSTAQLAAPQLVDPGFEAFTLARGPTFGWYSDDLIYPNDKRFGRVLMTPDSSTRVEGAYSLHIDQLEPRPPGRGQVFLCQALRLPASATASRRFELSVQTQGRMDGPLMIDIYVWEPGNVARAIARKVVTVSRSWSATTLKFDVPTGYDMFGIWFYLPPEQEAQLWLDDVRLRPLSN